MKIVFFEVENREKSRFEKLTEENEVIPVEDPLSEKNCGDYTDADILSPFIYSDLSRSVLERFDRLQMIATRSTGYDHIDLDVCRERQITVCNVPTYGDNTVAEHVFALLLMISHRLNEATDRTRKGDFSQKGLQGFDLKGKTLGVIGTGSIGQHVIKIAGGFDMKVIAYDVAPDDAAAARLGFEYRSFSDLIANADIITLHVPGTEKTRHLLSDKEFEAMKEGVVILNTSRGDVIDSKALLRAIGDNRVRAAGLDVLPEEPAIREEVELLSSLFSKKHDLENLLFDHILLRMQNVIITPHSAFNTREAVLRILDTTLENINGFMEGRIQNAVTGEG